MDRANRLRRQSSGAITLLAVLLVVAATWISAAAAPLRPSRAALNPEFLAYQEAVETMALPRAATDDGHTLGLVPSPLDLSHMTVLAVLEAQAKGPLTFAAQYDLRTLGRLTAVRDQGGCGSCWSFAAMSSLESWMLTTPVETWNFSENNLKECHGFDWSPCDGGNSTIAMAYFARQSGPISEADDPYHDHAVGCTSGLTVRKTVRDVLLPPDRGGSLDNDTIKQAVITYGAIATDLFWISSSYSSTNHSYYYSGAAGANHGVAIVGWNDTYSRTLFTSEPPGDGAWIVRNSWGAGWGESGYVYVSYYDTRVGSGNAAFINAVNPVTSTVYQYDPLGWVTNWGYGSTIAWGANAFTATSNGSITSVGTYASTVSTSYLVQIRSSLNGTVLATKSGTWPFAGYHTVDLDTPVAVTSGQTFVVAVRYTTPSYNFPIPAECYVGGYSSAATASAGQSYISSNGSTWEDITADWLWGDPTCNVCIKAIVVPITSSEDPVGYWRFNEGAGSTTADASGNGNTGTITSVAWVTGSPDSTTALSFSGSGQYVRVPTASPLSFSSAFTLEAWIRPSTLSGYRAIVVKRGGTGYTEAAYGLWTSGNKLYAEIKNYNRSSNASLTGNTSLVVGTWTHVALRRDVAGEVSLWVNGVKQTMTAVVTGAVNPPGDFFVGRHNYNPSEDFTGTIDEVRVHSRALDPGEFNLLPSGPVPTPPALVTNFTASDGADARSTLSWTNPSDSDLAQVVVLRKTGSYPTSHTDGTSVYDNASPTPAAPVSTVNTGLTNSTTYYYAVFSRDTGNLWNDTVTAGSNADTGAPAAAPPGGGPIGYWRFNEASGATALDSAGTNHGTITGATRVSGSPDGTTALLFSGSGQYVQVPNNTSLNFSGAFTVEAWVKPSGLSSYRAIVVKRGGTGYTEAAYGLWTSGNKLYAEIKNYNRSSNASLTGNTSLVVGTWTHVALRRDVAGEVSLWVNGVKQTMTAVVTGAVNPPGDFFVGRHNYNPSEDFTGTIDEVRLHNRALDPAKFNLLPRGASGAPDNAPAFLADPLAYPNPVRMFPVAFDGRDASGASILVRVYDLTGTLVFDSGWRDGGSLEWDGRDTRGEPVANGAYLYTIRTKSSAGSEREGRPQKLFALRD